MKSNAAIAAFCVPQVTHHVALCKQIRESMGADLQVCTAHVAPGTRGEHTVLRPCCS